MGKERHWPIGPIWMLRRDKNSKDKKEVTTIVKYDPLNLEGRSTDMRFVSMLCDIIIFALKT